MAVKEFNRFGLRRDNNFSDLPSPTTALNNLLNTPTMLGNEESFTTEDLLPIQQIYVTNITTDTFNSLNGVTVSFTVIVNGVIDNNQNPKVYRPLIKIKNRLDTAYFSTGEPFFLGGDGPEATYYDSEKIIRTADLLVLNQVYPVGKVVQSNGRLYVTQIGAVTSTQLNHTSGVVNGFVFAANVDSSTVFLNRDYEPVTGEDITITDNFWERGQFIYGNKVQNSFISLFGGVNWKGFYKPTVSGRTSFWLRTTGSTVFKFQSPSSPSYVGARYGKPSSIISNATFANTAQKNALLAILNDTTRSLVEVRLSEQVKLKDGDVVYLEVNEGPVIAKQYRVYTLKADATDVPMFWIEVTEDFNLLNQDVDNLPSVANGITYNASTGLIISDQTAISGYQSNARYIPYDRRSLKTYINSIYHKYPMIQGTFTVNNATTLTIPQTAEFIYYQMMINDYIYDYRKHGNEGQGVRRWIITGLNDSTRTVTVSLDTTYSITPSNNNDQQAYVGAGGTINFQSGSKIITAYTTGALNDTISQTGTQELYYVGRYGELTAREKYINIEQFLENYVDYAFDWLYFTKDEDVDPTAEKAWLLWQQNESSGYGPVNYKYLYDTNYKFYEIGDFKKFLDNSVPGGGTSRELGIEQRAFGRPKLLTKGDQYNTLFTLLPLQSIYTPQENWNKVALQRTATLTQNSRLVVLNNTTDVEVGNYIIQDTDNGFLTGDSIPSRTRIIEVLLNTNSVVTSKPSVSSGVVSSYVFDHRGFVTPIILTGADAFLQSNQAAYSTEFEKDKEIQVGNIMVLKSSPTESTYLRVTKVSRIGTINSDTVSTGVISFDKPVTARGLGAIYYDKGIDITKPLASFCTNTACAQNNYDTTSDTVKTPHILVEIGSGNIPGNDVRWTEASTTGSYNNSTSNPDRTVLTNGSASVSYWREASTNSNFENHGEAQFNGNKRYASNCIFAKLTGTNLAASLQEQGHTNLTSDYIPIGFIEGMVRVDGDIWNGTALNSSLKTYYFIIRLASRWQSYTDFDNFSDGGRRGKIVDFTKFPSSDFNLEYYGFAPNASIMLQLANSNTNVSTGAILDSARTNYVNNVNSSTYYDRIHRITANITLTSTQRAYFQNPDSFSRFNEVTQQTEYVLPQGSYFKTLSTTGLLVWFSNFEDLQAIHSLYSYPFEPSTQIPNQLAPDKRPCSSISIYPADGPFRIVTNTFLNNNQFRYLHYRRKQYELLPLTYWMDEKFPGLRLINNLEQGTNTNSHLQNSVNKLSVFTFAQTTDNKELCCPPLDTSPPFDSSAIGLSTTTSEPDMNIGGLVNVRSISATHPKNKIYNIPSTINGQAPNTQLPVNKKLGIVFGGIEYDLLIGDSKPF